MQQKFIVWLKNIWAFILKNKEFFVLLIFTVPAIYDLLRSGYFPMHDDLQFLRLFELDKCMADGQFPCRWVPDGGYGYGYPLMQFYPPMPYYPMYLLKFLGLGYFWPVKIMFSLAFVISGIGMYFLAKEFFGKWGGVISAIFYIYAPYHSVDIYVRGAMNEAWGMVWFPFVLLYIYKLIKNKFSLKNFIYFSTFLSLQLTSHNVMTLVFAPSAIVWAIFWLIESKNFKSIKSLILSGLLGVGLSAFFFIPVALESKYVHVDSMMSGYFNFMAHYADLNQLFITRFWGYGGSTWGPNDDMSFSVGQLQWVTALIVSVIALFKYKKHKTLSLLILMSSFFGLGYAFLTHSKSIDIWNTVSILQFAQFPWRLVALIVFYFSFVTGYLAKIDFSTIKAKKTLFILSMVAVVVWNLPFFKIERQVRVTTAEKSAGRQWELQVTGGIFDYLPRSAPKPPGDPAFTQPQISQGLGSVLNYQSGSNWMTFDVNISSNSAQVMLPLYTYPGLVTKLNGQKIDTIAEADLGRVTFTVPNGVSHVSAKIGYTFVRLFSDLTSLISILIIIILIKNVRRKS